MKKRLVQALSWAMNPKGSKIASSHHHDETVYPNHDHIVLAADWLLAAQAGTPDGGYACKYLIYKNRWAKSYIETTGYIIPSMFDVAKAMQNDNYRESALKAGEWLLEKQHQDGAFDGYGDTGKQVFDVGQCLIGLTRLFQETQDERYKTAAVKSADWLVSMQDQDGAWRMRTYAGQARTYYSRVGAALIECGRVLHQEKYVQAGMSNIRWVCGQQNAEGWFSSMEFKAGEKPFLHTMVYVLEGLLMAYRYTQDAFVFERALQFANALKTVNVERDIVLCSQYNDDYTVANGERCVTGLAQWSGVCLEFYGITKDKTFLKQAIKTIYYLKARQFKRGKNLQGGFPGSVPFYGKYSPAALPNWNNKFFIDAMLQYQQHAVSMDEEHETWVNACFALQSHHVSLGLVPVDYKCLGHVEPVLSALEDGQTVLDLGCGKGKHLSYLREKYPRLTFVGVDPSFADRDANIVNGSVRQIPLQDQSVDVIMCMEVLQHVRNLEPVFEEIKRVLKPGATFIVSDRNPRSLLGFLKKRLERMGKWMYPSDSPFAEKWYSKVEWQTLLNDAGFDVKQIANVNRPKDKIPGLNRYFVIYGVRAQL
ncbi:MAG: methyltransferase domain-containing protein [Gammaproteobacteria bacterium]